MRASVPTSTSSISHKISELEDLQQCVEKLLQLPLTQQAFAQDHQEKWVDQIVDGSLRLLDMCSTAKDAVLHTKECTREIQSIMRRKVSLEIEVRKYIASRKVVKKAIQKSLRSLKGVESISSFSPSTKDSEITTLVSRLREVEAVTLSAFESLLSSISGPKTQSKLGGWSLVSELKQSKRVGCNEEVLNEFAKVDAALHGLKNNKSKPDQAMLDLKNLEMCVQDFEERLEPLFRRLIKTRVSLLNTLNN